MYTDDQEKKLSKNLSNDFASMIKLALCFAKIIIHGIVLFKYKKRISINKIKVLENCPTTYIDIRN